MAPNPNLQSPIPSLICYDGDDALAIESYQDLEVWQKSMALAVVVYSLLREFPIDGQDALARQIHRSTVSIPSNIAEGWGRDSTKEYIRFLCIARGSLYELETQLLLAHRLGYLKPKTIKSLVLDIVAISQMLRALIHSLKR